MEFLNNQTRNSMNSHYFPYNKNNEKDSMVYLELENGRPRVYLFERELRIEDFKSFNKEFQSGLLKIVGENK